MRSQAISKKCRTDLVVALNRSPRQPITFAWAPGYDYKLQLWDRLWFRTTP